MTLKTSLMQHQSEAFEKLHRLKVGALYLEQGLGKTRTALELIRHRIENNKAQRVIWLCPCSVKKNLRDDIVKHVGCMPDFILIAGIESISSSVKLSVELLELSKRHNCFLIVDESNLVKNPKAIRSRRIEMIAQNCKYRIILNGTPISRNEADLFWQWYILDYRILGYKSYWSFERNHLEYDDYGRIKRVLDVDYLAKKIAPYTYQKKKSECLDLPRKIYVTEYFDMTDRQREHYHEVADEYLMNVDEFKPETLYRLFTALQHVVAGKFITSEYEESMTTRDMFVFEDNPRWNVLEQVIPNQRTIIWCKYTSEIKNIHKLLPDSVMFYGKMILKKRNESIEQFRNGDAMYFIANKACAGYGLNLQFCNNVIYYSNDWDFATRQQSEDRVHRIGQEREVYIADICCDNSIDSRILNCLNRKERLLDYFKYCVKNKLKIV